MATPYSNSATESSVNIDGVNNGNVVDTVNVDVNNTALAITLHEDETHRISRDLENADRERACALVLEAGFKTAEAPLTHAAFYHYIVALLYRHRQAHDRGGDLPLSMRVRASITASLCTLWIRGGPEAIQMPPGDVKSMVPRLVAALCYQDFLQRLQIDIDREDVDHLCRSNLFGVITTAVTGLMGPALPPMNDDRQVAQMFYPAILGDGLLTERQLGWDPVKAAGKE